MVDDTEYFIQNIKFNQFTTLDTIRVKRLYKRSPEKKNVQYLIKHIENIFIIQIICPKFSSNRKNFFLATCLGNRLSFAR